MDDKLDAVLNGNLPVRDALVKLAEYVRDKLEPAASEGEGSAESESAEGDSEESDDK